MRTKMIALLFACLATTAFADPCVPFLERAKLRLPEFEKLPRVDAQFLVNLQAPHDLAHGENNDGLYWAYFYDSSVFVKVPRDNFEQEAVWTQWLSDKKIGPYFFGRTKIDGRDALVSQYFRGKMVSAEHGLGTSAKYVTPKTLEQLEHIREVFVENRVNPYDFQILLHPEGYVTVIDGGAFEVAKENANLNSTAGFKDMDDLIKEVRAVLKTTSSRPPTSQNHAH